MRAVHRQIAAIIVLSALFAGMLAIGASADSQIYVNDSANRLEGGLSSAYVIGGNGDVFQLGSSTAYAMTGSGVVRIGASAPSNTPVHLSVSGTVAVKYPKIKVGLFWEPGLEYANLENAVGSGYRFGYYDSARNFLTLAWTDETKLTMSMDTNLDLPGGHIGCYHIMLSGTYSDFDSARSVAAQYYDGFPAYYNGTYYVLLGQYDNAADATADAAARGVSGMAYSASNRCIVVSRTSDSRILFEFDCGSDKNLAVSPQAQTKAVTWFKSYKYYGDFEYIRRSGEKITVVNVVDIEDYVKGILPYEMSSSWPLEALKTQAVCARTYAVSNIGTYSSYGFDLRNDASSQVYRGTNYASANSDAAVDATKNQYITYNGKPISALFYSSNGGGSENSENVFSASYGYLRGVIDPYEQAAASINGKSSWTFTHSKSDIYSMLVRYNSKMGLGDVSAMEVTYSDTGNAVGLKFTDSSGRSYSIVRNSCYAFSYYSNYMALPSIHYTMKDNGSSITFTGSGWGHSVGMSQFGAYAMARYYGFTYDQIVSFYYTGVSLSSGIYG